MTEKEIDEFEEYIANYSYATLTPKNENDTIYIHLGGINETDDKYFSFFQLLFLKKSYIFLQGN